MIKSWFATFPVFETVAGVCACRDPSCEDIGKHPEYPYSQLQPGERLVGVEGRNLGIATGSRSQVFVVDFDNLDIYAEMADRLPETYAVATSRGVHLYYRLPAGVTVRNSQSVIAPKVDIRGEGGFVLAAGSVHKSGVVYECLDDRDPVDPPAWLLEKIGTPADATPRAAGDNAPKPVEGAELDRRTKLAITYLTDAPPAIQGENGSRALWAVALQLVRKYELPLDVCAELIEEHYNPRCQPEWSASQIDHKLEDARDKSEMPTGIAPEGLSLMSPETLMFNKLATRGEPEVDCLPIGLAKQRPARFDEVVMLLSRHEAWQGVFRYNVLERRHVAVNPPIPLEMAVDGSLSDGDITKIKLWLMCPTGVNDEGVGYVASHETVHRAIAGICEANKFNPAVEWLDSLPRADGTEELDRFHETVLRSPDGPLVSAIIKKHLVAAVRRIRAAGTRERVDHQIVVVLAGEQDVGKTRLLKLLAGEWYGSLVGDLSNKDTVLQMRGKVFVELEEMTSATRADRNALKAFLSRDEDELRAPFGRSAKRVPRSYVLWGTSNDPQLDDPTGGRRFVIVQVGQIDIEYATVVRDRLWAEAAWLAAQPGYDHHLTPEEKTFAAAGREIHEREDPTADMLKVALRGVTFVTLFEAWDIATKGDHPPTMPRAEQTQMCDSLRRIGCKPYRNEKVRGWKIPNLLSTMQAEPSVTSRLTDARANDLRQKLTVN